MIRRTPTPRLARPAGPSLFHHPLFILFHISGITAASMMIPVIKARYVASSAASSSSSHPSSPTSPPPLDDHPPPRPYPAQLYSLSRLVKSQLEAAAHDPFKSAFDALFTLRQLHMVKPPPRPPPRPPAGEKVYRRKDKWIWGWPATSAIHGILRVLDAKRVAGVESEKDREGLRELLDKLVDNGMSWDKTIRERDASMENVNGVETRPMSSISPKTLEAVILFLASTLRPTPDATTKRVVSVLKSMDELQIKKSPALFDVECRLHLLNNRPDLAAQAWCRRISSFPNEHAVESSTYVQLLTELKRAVHPKWKKRNGKTVLTAPPRIEVLLAVAQLSAKLRELWNLPTTSSINASSQYHPISLLVPFLTSYPQPFHHATLRHREAYCHVQDTLVQILSDLAHVDLALVDQPSKPGSTRPFARRVVIGASTSPSPRPTLNPSTFATLITYSQKHLRNQVLGQLLTTSPSFLALPSSPETSNALVSLPHIPSSEKVSMAMIAEENERTLPTLVKSLNATTDITILTRLTFAIIPELNIDEPSHYAPTPKPPKPFRSPEIYVALLTGLVKAGKTGLAERVFRLARWAAELSRTEAGTESEQPDAEYPREAPWTLPPKMFDQMLRLYASEARDRAQEHSMAVGWGRQAMRREQKRQRAAVLGETEGFSYTRAVLSSLDLPKYRRDEVARLAAAYELETWTDYVDRRNSKGAAGGESGEEKTEGGSRE
ncbi:hypothetical protein MNV49_006228 [Pseudohyphozyma bogoriensis]|nr:hypothetical protein MNV49_006228 [Pseudohyphozyma bogoriensis]